MRRSTAESADRVSAPVPQSRRNRGALLIAGIAAVSVGFVAGVGLGAEPETSAPIESTGRIATRDPEGDPRAADPGLTRRPTEGPTVTRTDPGRVGATASNGDPGPLDGPPVEGTVRDDQGRPVPGARVFLSGRFDRWFEPLVETRTDEAGRFVFEHTSTGVRLQFEAESPGLAFLSRQLDERTRNRHVRLDGVPGRRIEIDVRLPDGSAPRFANLVTFNSLPDQDPIWTPDRRTMHVPQDLGLQLMAFVPSRDPDSSRRVEFRSQHARIGPDGPSSIELELSPVTRLVGSVRSEHLLVEGLNVRLINGNPSIPGGYGGSGTIRSGRFEIEDVQPGEWELQVLPTITTDPASAVPFHREPIRLDAGDAQQVSIEVGVPDPAEFLRVVCTETAGNRLEDCRYSAEPTQAGPNGSPALARRIDVTRFADLSVAISRVALFGPEGQESTALIRVHHAHYGSMVEPVRATDTAVELRFGEAAGLVVSVDPGPWAAAYEDVRLQLRIAPESQAVDRLFQLSGDRLQMIDDLRATAIPGLRSGRYRLALHLQRNQPALSQFVTEQVVDLQPGENQVVLTLPALEPFTVHSRTLEEGTELSLRGPLDTIRNDARTDVTATIDASGIATFPPVPSGLYALRLRGGGAEPAEVRLPLNGFEFSPRPFDCLVVLGLVAGSPLERDGLLNGDKIIAIDGVPVRSMGSQRAIDALPPPGDRLLTVIRDGDEFEVRTMRGFLLSTSVVRGHR